MNLVNKISNIIFSLLGLAVAITLFIVALGWSIPIELLENILLQRDARLGIAAVSVLLAIWALYTLQSNINKKTDVNKFTSIQTTDLGQVHITTEAIENIISRAAASMKEIKEIKTNQKILPEGIAFQLKVTVNTDTSVPEATRKLQEKVAGYLKEYGGINVLEIEVVVDKIVQAIKGRVE